METIELLAARFKLDQEVADAAIGRMAERGLRRYRGTTGAIPVSFAQSCLDNGRVVMDGASNFYREVEAIAVILDDGLSEFIGR